MLRIVLALLIVFSAFVRAQDPPSAPPPPPPKTRGRELNRAVFLYAKDRVWAALMEALTDASLHPETMDRESGTIFFKADAAWGSRWGDANSIVARVSTKVVKGASTWQAVAAIGNVYCKVLEPEETEVRVNLKFFGCNGWRAAGTGYSCLWEPLESNGFIEGQILNGMEGRLPARQASPQAESRPDVKTLEAGRQVLALLQKVDAAHRLDAGKEQILSRLVDAAAALDELGPEPLRVLAPAVENLRAALAFYRKALDASDRKPLTEQAGKWLRAAREQLEEYEQSGWITPKAKLVPPEKREGPSVK